MVLAAAEEEQPGGAPAAAERGVLLFHSPGGEAFATILIGGHFETWAIRSKGFAQYLRYLYLRSTRRAANARMISEARDTLEARAIFDGPAIEVHTRVAGDDDAIYLDLCDPQWRVVEITSRGWRIVDGPPVRFRRADGMLALPEPVHGATLDELKPFVSVKNPEQWLLHLAYLAACFRPRGPYPALVLYGGQGAAKSTRPPRRGAPSLLACDVR